MLNIGNVVLQRVRRGGTNGLHGAYKRFVAVLDEFRNLLGSISECEMDLRGNSGLLAWGLHRPWEKLAKLTEQKGGV